MVLLQTFTPSANPLGSQWLSALLAVLPVLAMLITLGALRWKAHLAGLFSWGVALIVAITAFPMPIGMAFSSSVQGFLYGLFPISWILLGAIWMYQVTVISGRFDDLRRTFGMVLQDTWLFRGTIRENIAYGADGATEERLAAAAAAAHVDHFVRTLPAGYETVLDDDASSVSAGEKQLLTIARAFLDRGIHVICDKPMTNSLEDALDLVGAHYVRDVQPGEMSVIDATQPAVAESMDGSLVGQAP